MAVTRLAFCCLFTAAALVCSAASPVPADRVDCPGAYGGHLQGLATDGAAVYWSFTKQIVKTDLAGKLLAVQEAPSHQGDLCVKDGVVYVAVNRGRFNHETGAVSEVTAYEAATLKPIRTWPLPEMPHGAGGMTWRGDRFFVVGGLPASHECNYVYEYTPDFKLVRRHDLPTGFTLMGIQTAAYEEGRFLFGIYGDKGNPSGVLVVADDLKTWTRYTGPGNVGILRFGGRYYVGGTGRDPKTKGNTGCIQYVPGFLGDASRYVPPRAGGTVRLFFAGRDTAGWTDSGYALIANGYRPLSRFDAAYRPAGETATGSVAAVCLGTGHAYSVPDLVRGVRRAAAENETIAFSFAGTPETVAADAGLTAALAAIRREAAALDVPVVLAGEYPAYTVDARPGYNSWPMIQAIGDTLVCTYSRGTKHDIFQGVRKVLACRSTDGGRTWSGPVAVADDPAYGEVTIGKGLDADGAMLLWVRCYGGPKPHHDLYRTTDGVRFEKIATPSLSPLPMQITDVFAVPGKGLVSLWFAGNYRDDDRRKSWGMLTSADNGRTWVQRTVEKDLAKDDWPTEPSAVYLGDGKILVVARSERYAPDKALQFQITSTDGGETWTRAKTNIRDVMASTPSLILDPATGLLSNYYYERGKGGLKRRVVKPEDVFDRPTAWPEPQIVARGSDSPWDSGNASAVALGKKTHAVAFYSGKGANTVVLVAPVPAPCDAAR